MESGRRPSEDLWRRTLSQIPTVYGRLVYLASLRNADTGRYEHHGLTQLFGGDEANQALRESHVRSFADWLAMNLEQQKADLELYFSAQPAHRRTLVENWVRLTPYRNLPPSSASRAERELFLNDLEMLLDLIRNEYGGGPASPGGWRRR